MLCKKMSKPKKCPFSSEGNCYIYEHHYGCNHNPEDYTKCWQYANVYLELNLPFPQICPLIDQCHEKAQIQHQYGETKEENCPCDGLQTEHLDAQFCDYRSCEDFSKWFWEKRKNGNRNQNQKPPSENETSHK